ncbi:interferon-related developmental regulator 2-like isoform X1 [Chiloscyllium plagiosum]|uniref:interferon-related developmental regulator 2-like isoform X1 n=1 Tax=Chiloscyllium plagiosum TaxID=36176 RepID=UPI001CB7D68B|nr:interferon-related developmental regulator 2-like isoform X1 [Chiloscyllium plagiosum]
MPKSRGRTGHKKGSLRHELLQLKVSAKVAQQKGGQNGIKGDTHTSDDDLASEVLSHCSSASETASVPEEGGEGTNEQMAQEEAENKLKECIDNTMDKSAKVRQNALESLKLAFSSKILADFLVERRVTLTDCLERCLKKGKGEEQAIAATVISLLCIQLGSCKEGEDVFKTLKSVLTNIFTDKSSSLAARHSTAVALGTCCYIAANEAEDLASCLACLESVFSASYIKGDGLVPSHNSQTQVLHYNALQSWSLLVTICPTSKIQKLLENHLPKLPGLLCSDSVTLRIAAGEAIALLFELARKIDQDFLYEGTDQLCEKLKGLATDSNKHRAKNDRRKQRSIFRDVLHFIEDEECPEETIKFGIECLCIDSWVKRRVYDAFKEILGSGIRHHLQHNELLRDIFELGPPLMLDAAAIRANKISRFEKHLYNSAAFKARTKARSKVRDKRADVL